MNSSDGFSIALIVLICASNSLAYVMLYLIYNKVREIRKELYVMTMVDIPKVRAASAAGGGSVGPVISDRFYVNYQDAGTTVPASPSLPGTPEAAYEAAPASAATSKSSDIDSNIVKVDELDEMNDLEETFTFKPKWSP
jgi:hypothetical protein